MARGWPLFLGSPVRGRPVGGVPHKAREIPHETTSRHRSPKKSRLTNATEITACAECTSRRRPPPLPSPRPQTGQILDSRRHKRRQGALALCAPGPPGIPEKWTDATTNKHGDLRDLIRLHTGGASLRRAMDEALAFLSLPPSTPANGAPPRACSALGSTPNVPPKPTSPARAKRFGVSTAAPCASASPPPAPPCLSAKTSKPFSINRQPWRLRTTTRPRPVGHRPRKRCGRQVRREPSLAPLCQTRHSLNRDRSRTLMILTTTSLPSEKKPLRFRSRPLLQASSPRQRWKRGVGVGE